MSIKKESIKVYDMTCTSCEDRIVRALKKLPGVNNAMASFGDAMVIVEYDTDLCNKVKIINTIKTAGYSTEKPASSGKILGFVFIALAVFLLSKYSVGFDMSDKLTNATYLVLFVVGILTSIHCVGMCGGIMLSQSISKDGEQKGRLEAMKPAVMYNAGRVISYTILGGVVGTLGSVIALSLQTKAALQIFAGVFMIIMGCNMAGFSWFRKIHIRLPWSACSVKKKPKAPFVVGLLNGFMPCGPLQTMQLYALGTGSMFKGALSMFIFALGTVPLMLTFGAISGLLSKGYTKKILKFSGILVIVLGLMMGNRGLVLAGVNVSPVALLSQYKTVAGGPEGTASAANIAKPEIQNGVQVVKIAADYNGYTPNVIFVQKGIPVKWIIDGQQITSCNNAIVVPSLNIQKTIKKGENVIEFTPTKTGDINFSCWMGMIRGLIRVVDDVKSADTSNSDSSLPPPSTPSCCSGAPAADGGAAANQGPSIYGNDITKVPTDRIIKKATVNNGTQVISFKGVGYELDPLIIVANKSLKTQVILDMTKFDTPEGSYQVVEAEDGKVVKEFEGKKEINKVDLDVPNPIALGIMKDGKLLSIIEVVDDIKTVDLESLRSKYLGQ